MPPPDASSSANRSRSIADADPVTRNALRYTVSAREYELLHQYLISRTPVLRQRAPSPQRATGPSKYPKDDNAATIRISSRLFLATFSSLKAWELVSQRLFERRRGAAG